MPYTDDENKANEQNNAYREDKEEYPLLQIVGIILALIIGAILAYMLFMN